MGDLVNLFRPRPKGFYTKGDPRFTSYVEKLWRIANAAASLPIDQAPDRMFVSSEDYEAILAELKAQYEAPSESPGYLIFGKKWPFRVFNAGTNDLATINRMNESTPGAIDFGDRLRQFATTPDPLLLDTSPNAHAVDDGPLITK